MPRLQACLLLAGLIGLLLPAAAHADQKSDDIALLMALGGNDATAMKGRVSATLDASLQRFANAHPNVPADALATVRAQMQQQVSDLFNKVQSQVRARYYADLTDDEVRAIIAFYGSPAGQAYLREGVAIGNLMASDLTYAIPLLVIEWTRDFAAALKRQTPPPQAG